MLKMLKRSSRILCSLLVAMTFIAMVVYTTEATEYWYTSVTMSEQQGSTKYTMVYGVQYSSYNATIQGECFKGRTQTCIQYYDKETGKYIDSIPTRLSLSKDDSRDDTFYMGATTTLVRGRVSANCWYYPYDSGSVAIKIVKPY